MPLLLHRNTNNSTAKRWISVGTCWHLDTWFVEVQNTPWLVARTGDGTGKTIGLTAWELVRSKLGFGLWERGASQPVTDASLQAVLGKALLVTSPQARQLFGSAAQADIAFKACVFPLGAQLWPRGTYPRRSICHHMLAPVYVSDPCDHMRNLYAETGRAERDITLAQRAR